MKTYTTQTIARTVLQGALTLSVGAALSLAMARVSGAQTVNSEPTSVSAVGPEGAYAGSGVFATRYNRFGDDNAPGVFNWKPVPQPLVVLTPRRFGFYRREVASPIQRELARLNRGGLPSTHPFAGNISLPR